MTVRRLSFMNSKLLFVLFLVLTLSCSQESDSSGTTASSEAAAPLSADDFAEPEQEEASGSPLNLKAEGQRSAAKEKPGNQPQFRSFKPSTDLKGRWLEYTVQLEIETTDFAKTREELYKIAGRYGYLTGSNLNTDPESTSLSVQMRVRSEQLEEVLFEIDSTGKLLAENISVADHTGSVFRQEVMAEMQAKRAARRAVYANASREQNRAEMERMLSQTENEAAENKIQRWNLEDRVRFANISVYVSGPPARAEVDVPEYGNALVAGVNLFLDLLYVVLLLFPLWLIAGLLFVLRKKLPGFKKLFQNKTKESE